MVCLALVFFCAGPAAAAVPHSGLTQCYDDTKQLGECPKPGEPFYGQDGNYAHLRPPKYVKLDAQGNALPDTATLEDGWVAVRDEVTGLVWQLRTDDTTDYRVWPYVWCDPDPATNDGSEEGCVGGTAQFLDDLNTEAYGGHTDWRLPSTEELVSLLDYSRTGPALNRDFFPYTLGYYFWTKETKAADPDSAWQVGFATGEVAAYAKNSFNVYARAVRGPEMVHDFVDNGDGTISDRALGLMWTAAPMYDSKGYTWQQALKTAETATVAGYDDWRLPSIKEWASLIDRGRSNPALPGVFQDTIWYTFWTATTYVDDPDVDDPDDQYGPGAYAWIVNTSKGDFSFSLKVPPPTKLVTALRLVRDIPQPVLAGDVDGSGAVELADAVILLDILAGIPVPDGVTVHARAAVDGSGRLGSADIVYILRQLAQ